MLSEHKQLIKFQASLGEQYEVTAAVLQPVSQAVNSTIFNHMPCVRKVQFKFTIEPNIINNASN